MTTLGRRPSNESDADLREYADRMAVAERIAHFGVWRWEIDTGEVRWSEQLQRIYGLEPGKFGGMVDDFVAFLHPDDRQRVWAAIEHAMITREPFMFDERIVRPDGTERVLLSEGQPITGQDGRVVAMVGVCHDVSDRIEAERAHRKSDRRLRAIIDNSPSMVAVKDLEGRYLVVNSEVARVVGRRPDELVGVECAELFPSVAEQLRANDHLAVEGAEVVYDEAVLELDGEPRTYETVTFALPDEAGHPSETCTIATDVTESREHESVRRQRLEWEQRIGSALAEGRMLVYAQPVVDVATGARTGCELLVRMREPAGDGEVLAPA